MTATQDLSMLLRILPERAVSEAQTATPEPIGLLVGHAVMALHHSSGQHHGD